MRTLIVGTFLLLPALMLAADGDSNPPDRRVIGGVEVVMLNGNPYRVVSPEVLAAGKIADGDLYIEAKLESLTPPNHAKAVGLNTALILDSVVAKAAQALKPGDNFGCCGTLKAGADGKGLELHVLELHKSTGEQEAFEQRIAALKNSFAGKLKGEERAVLADSAIELGRRIDAAAQRALDFNARNQLEKTRDEVYTLGLQQKEAALKPDDADGYFELSEQWYELRHDLARRRQLVLACLKIDPDHARASRVAAEKFEWVRLGRDWFTKEAAAERQAALAVETKRLADAREAERLRKTKERDDAIAQRPEKLRMMRQSLATSDPTKLEGALESACREIADCAEPGFGVQAVEILAAVEHPVALGCGLNAASQNQFPEVRREAFEALAWRSRIASDQEAALQILTAALQHEKDADTARTGVEALVATRQQPAIGSLVASLSAANAPVRLEIIAGLRNATGKEFTTADEWVAWWQKTSGH